MKTLFWTLIMTIVVILSVAGYTVANRKILVSPVLVALGTEELLQKITLTWIQLPIQTRKYISDHFSGCRIEEMNELKSQKSDKIEVFLFKDHYRYELIFNKEGELLKQIKHVKQSQ
ncbi:MAG: hypothetical protein J7604_08610 [Sporocytophaga sp.]|uniref:hypothetical protein n=1 Tax=Sporocytophaga sp. TaxID=2231183 RepID=UPI001B17FD37|nr:hypothetical protein [Sporocytophaga sp.]MBO9700258.1 hypothetical protein [Sporocytophaga sp.]